ncbi:MAG: ferritin-like domain-containing protein [Chitinophagaceae bacterium]
MQTSQDWIIYFRQNLRHNRIDWTLAPQLTDTERKNIVQSVQAWQLGETSDGAHLLAAAKRYADKIGDPDYCAAVQLFIKEEQKHGHNLGHYLDLIQERRITHDWGDTLFRKIRYLNTSMELWTIAVITVESAAQVFYQALKEATSCTLLKQVCTDILIDEAAHINFQQQRLQIIFSGKTVMQKIISFQFYRLFYFSTILVVWMAHRKLFKSGNINLAKYLRKMNFKFAKTIQKLHPSIASETDIPSARSVAITEN